MRATTGPNWNREVCLGTRVVDRYKGDNGDDVDVNEKEETSQSDDGLMQDLED
jgi:hypothetical protein